MSDKDVTKVVPADAQGIARAARILTEGGLVAVPTETVYGLAARADSADAVAKIYAVKGRPDFNPLIVHVRDVNQAKLFADWNEAADIATGMHWPGPLTIVVPAKSDREPDNGPYDAVGNGLARAVTAGLPTIALRCPSHPVMRALLHQCDFPLAAPSANRSGFISPTSAEHVLASLDRRIDLVLDAGPSVQGVESTILAIRDDGSWEELRPGPVDIETLHGHGFERGFKEWAKDTRIEAPGQLASHYAPGKPVRLNAQEVAPDEFWIGFGADEGDCNLSPGADLNQAAARLYDCLHQGAASDKPRIAIAPVPDEGIGRAINDRLRRAATPPD